jgi:hypothetical protein
MAFDAPVIRSAGFSPLPVITAVFISAASILAFVKIEPSK